MVEESDSAETEHQTQTVDKSKIVKFTDSNHFKLLTFAYLRGCELFHKFAVLNKQIRAMLPRAGLLDQNIVIGIIPSENYLPDVIKISSFLYAVSLADSIRVTIDKT